MADFSSISFAVCTASKSLQYPIKLGYVQQLVAAALGYKTLAAFQASPLEAPDFDAATHLVIDRDLLGDRIRQLDLPYSVSEVIQILRGVFNERMPGVHLQGSLDELHSYIREFIERSVISDDSVTTAMATSNGDGVHDVAMDLDDLDLALASLKVGEHLELEFDGQVTMGIDSERPYFGHEIDVRVKLKLARIGKMSFGKPKCVVLRSHLDLDWGDEDHESPQISLAEALAEETGLSVDEADELTFASSVPHQSSNGLVYGHVFDFTEHASPSVAAKLRAKYGSLQVTLPPWLMDRIHSS